jgi:hypothetical protein
MVRFVDGLPIFAGERAGMGSAAAADRAIKLHTALLKSAPLHHKLLNSGRLLTWQSPGQSSLQPDFLSIGPSKCD